MRPLLTLLFIIAALPVFAQRSPADVVDKQLKAYNSRDIDAFVATYADHIEIYEYGQPTPFVTGKTGLRASYGAMFQTSPNLNAHTTTRIVQGSKVIDHEIADGINGRDPIQVVAIYEIAAGLIEKVTFIYN